MVVRIKVTQAQVRNFSIILHSKKYKTQQWEAYEKYSCEKKKIFFPPSDFYYALKQVGFGKRKKREREKKRELWNGWIMTKYVFL